MLNSTMNNDDVKKLSEFLAHFDSDRAIAYLLSGLAARNNFQGKMTPQLFYDIFWVHNDAEIEENTNQIINDLFEDHNHNMLCLMGDAGSGKSTFVNTLNLRLDDDTRHHNYEYIILDCAITSRTTEWENYPFSSILQRYRKLIKALSKMPEKNKNYYRYILNKVVGLDNLPNDDDDEFATEFKQHMTHIIEALGLGQDGMSDLPTSYSRRTNAAFKNVRSFSVMTAFLLLLTCINICESNNKKYIIVFDNIEAYMHQAAIAICDFYGQINSFIREIYSMLSATNDLESLFRFERNYMTSFTFVYCIRSTTNLEIDTVHNRAMGFWGRANRYKIYRRFYDFSTEAMLKKLKFLYDFKSNDSLYKSVYEIVAILVPQGKIDYFLRNGEMISDDDVKYFTAHRYLPFFNNNYRNAINILDELYKRTFESERWIEYLKPLINSNNNENEIEKIKNNAARMIIFRAIFDYFVKQSYFQTYGIKELSGRAEHSTTRIILAFLYWQQVTHVGNLDDEEYEGESLDRVINFFHSTYSEDEIIGCLQRLSIFDSDNEKKRLVLGDWAPLVSFGNGADSLTIATNLRDNRNEAKVKLTAAGYCYIEFVSIQFEFFLSRAPGKSYPLFFYDNRKNNLGEFEFKDVIDKVYDAVEMYIDGMLKDCFHKENAPIKCGSHHECQLFIRAQNVFATISEQMNYVDRFRLYLVDKYCGASYSRELNKSLLQKLHLLNKLYDTAKKHLPTCCVEASESYKFGSHIPITIHKPFYATRLSRTEFEIVINAMINENSIQSLYGYIQSYNHTS